MQWGLRGLEVASKVCIMMTNRLVIPMLGLGAAACVAGCSVPAGGPVSWWHTAEGGKIAEQRPAAPNVNAPYPNLASVPAAPAAPDEKARAGIAQGLVADRANAQYAQTLSPLPPPPDPAARPTPAPQRQAGVETSGATLVAAQTASRPPGPLGPPQPPLPNVPPTPPRKAATQPVQSAPLPPPTNGARSAPPANSLAANSLSATALPATAPSVARPAAPVASLPRVPDAPPPPPVLAGIPAATAPTPAPIAPPPPPQIVGVAGAPITVPFEAGSASLPPQALASLKVLSRQRGAGAIAVMGYGDAQGSDAATQSTALPLALARARAIAMTLMAAGVPPNAIRINAEAKGQGGVARVTD